MNRLPASAAEPRHVRGGAGGAGRAETVLPPWHGQKVKLAKRVWGSGHYSHGAVRYAAQVAALAQRGRRCRATVATLAAYMGDGKRTAERRLAELAAQGPDGVPEMEVTRHTAAGGKGESAERRMRPVAPGEHFAYVPVAAAKTLRPALFAAYCALTYADATNTPATAAELASLLGVTERSARRLVDELEALGWITVHRREGRQGRHQITVHDHPLHPVPDPAGPDTDGGSGPDPDGGSLAIKEDTGLTDGSTTQVGGAFRRRRGTGSKPATPVDTAGNGSGCNYPVAAHAPVTFRPAVPRPRRPYDGPQLTLSPRVWTVLEPVRDLLPGISPYLVRRIAREIGRQLDDGIWAEDIRDQLARMRRWTPTEEIRDPGRWLLGAALPPRPGKCGTTDCHYGFQRYTGLPCKACAELEADRARGAHPPHTAPWHECTECQAPSRQPLPGGLCHTCTAA
ncbi:SgrR family transcriptional regulator [Streptomyces sp. Z423-1]|uniref:SgrR family transcriptional regulator n=1 Tax=unclassified Streptomyces TaxID=2593676 RepID=UPI00148898D0|nr:SgrR family transcriptional regulator [Streptomyces sp. Z423-1]